MIQSGRTKCVSEQLIAWYKVEYRNTEMDWEWGYNEKYLEKILDEADKVSFKKFFIRYLVEVHQDDLKQYAEDFGVSSCDAMWTEQFSKIILEISEGQERKTYLQAEEILCVLTDLIYEDYITNGYTGFSMERTKILLSKTKLLRIMLSDDVTEGNLWHLGFGLNIDVEDLSFFLKKVLRREDFNFWNREEFLMYLTFRYAQGNRYHFYEKLSAAYESAEVNSCVWMETEGFSTIVIRNETEALMERIKEKYKSLLLMEDGIFPKEFVTLLGSHKYILNNQSAYTRTRLRECEKLYREITENLEAEIKAFGAIRKKNDQKMQPHAHGYIHVYYDPRKGVQIPKETAFYRKKGEELLRFFTKDEIRIDAVEKYIKDVSIPVKCTQNTVKMESPEMEIGYVPNRTKFVCDCAELTDIYNKSRFKTPTVMGEKQIKLGEQTCVTGTLQAKCTGEQKIPPGVLFKPLNSIGKNLSFISTKEIDGTAFVNVYVECEKPFMEVSKNEITECGLENWREKFIKFENSKIGINKKRVEEQEVNEAFYNYLYYAIDLDSNIVRQEYFDKLNALLKDTRMSSTKLNQIRNLSMKEDNIKRSDIITLSFLAYISRLEKKRVDQNMKNKDDYRYRRTGFVQQTNRILKKCGYYELYAPNPYDSLIICLLSSNEAVNAFRNIWGWYLRKKKELEEVC